jgi:hypothetical protein
VDETLLDEVRLAVGEACSRAVEAHRRHCPAEPVKIEMTDQGERFVVVVSDQPRRATPPCTAPPPAPTGMASPPWSRARTTPGSRSASAWP